MYAAAMGNTITAVFQCLLAISVKGFFAVAFVCFAPVLYLVQMFEYTLLFGRSALFFSRRLSDFLLLWHSHSSKITVVLRFHNAFHFSESPHKRLYIGITVFFQNIGQFCPAFRKFSLRSALSCSPTLLRSLPLKMPLSYRQAAVLDLWQYLVLQVFDFLAALSCTFIIRFRIWRNSAISISSVGLGGISFSRIRFCRKSFAFAHNPAEQVGQPAFAFDRLACFFVYLGLLDL